jgi:hypothetical protein
MEDVNNGSPWSTVLRYQTVGTYQTRRWNITAKDLATQWVAEVAISCIV